MTTPGHPPEGRSPFRLREVPARRSPAPDVVVLGGGIIGLAAAWELAREGAQVEVVERHEHGGEASVAAAGILGPLSEVPTGGPLFEACRDSRDRWAFFRQELEQESDLPLDYDTSGALMVACAEGESDILRRLAEAAHELGEEAEEVPGHEARRRVPALTTEIRRCLHLPGEHRVDNIKAVAALDLAAARRGVRLSRGQRVESVTIREHGVHLAGPGWSRDAAVLVVAAGAWSGQIPGLPPFAVRPVRGQMLLLGGVDWEWSGIVRGPKWYTVRRGAAGLLVGATVEDVGFENHSTVQGLHDLLGFTRTLLPGLGEHRVETFWTGLRPVTPDGAPLLGRLSSAPVIVACGHGRNGILLAPWTARLVAAMVLDGDTPPEAEPFAPDRFIANR